MPNLIHNHRLKEWYLRHQKQCVVLFKGCAAQILKSVRYIFQSVKELFLFVGKPVEMLFNYIAIKISMILQQWWLAFREIKIANQSIGVWIDGYISKLKQHPWVCNLLDASIHDTRGPTWVSTCFANILALVFPLALMQVYDRIVPNRSVSTLVFISIGVVMTFAVEATLRIIRAQINLWADTKYEFDLAKTAFDKVMNAPMYVAEKTDVGMRLKQFTILDQLKGFYNTQLLTSLYEIPFLLIFLAVIAYLGGWLFLVPLLVTGCTAYFTWRFSMGRKNLLNEKIAFEAKESDFIINVLTSIHTAKSIGMEELLTRRHEKLQESGTTINYLTSIHEGDLGIIKTISSQGITVLTTTFGSMLVVHGNLAIGGLAACILLSGRVMQPFDRILSALNRLSMINIVRKKLDPIFELPAEDDSKKGSLEVTSGEIELKNIFFHYGKEEESKCNILENINLKIEANKLTGIVGDDQSQKTALLNILALITKPSSGEYRIDNNKIDNYDTNELHKKIAYLNRVGKLFRGSIMDNLSAFDESLIPNARRLVDRLGLNAILSKLPNGYDTYVGEKAVEALPGGVMNLIFIIRALVSKPKIILYDEVNINLDTHYTKKMIDLLVYLKELSNVIVFVHKQSTLELMDVVYKLNDKNILRVEYAQ